MQKEWIDKIQLLHENDEHEKIVELINNLGEPDYDAYGYRARAYNNLGEAELALKDLLAIKEQGKDDWVWNYRTMYSYSLLMNAEKVVEYGTRAVGHSEDLDWDIADFLSHAYFDLEKIDECMEILLRYKKQESSFWNELLARCYYIRGDMEKATIYLQNAIDAFEAGNAAEDFEEYFVPTLRFLIHCYEKLNQDERIQELKQKYPELEKDIALYTEEDLDILENHIKHYFGNFEQVYHESVSDIIHVDIALSLPSPERNHYVLTTMGMGAKIMEQVPQELREKGIGRLELMIALPADWDIHSSDEKWYWPLRWLKILARFPFEEDTWLGWGHSIPKGDVFAENTKMNTILLDVPYEYGEDSYSVSLSNGEEVHFLQLLPIYQEEAQYKIKNGTQALLQLFDKNFSGVVDIKRKNYAIGKNNRGNGWKNSPFK